MKKEFFELNVLGSKWEICLDNNYYSPDSVTNSYDVADGYININFNPIRNKDQLLAILFDALFDGIIDKYCGDEWDSKFIANVVSQLFNSPKSNKTIGDIVKHFNRYNINGEQYEMFNEDDILVPYLFDSIDIKSPYYWEFDLYMANIAGDVKVEFSRSGFTESYTLTMDPTKFSNGNEMAKSFATYVENSPDSEFINLDNNESNFTVDKLKRRLKSTNYESIKQRLIDEYDEIINDFDNN